ncbi:MAG TPA: hypothetical protein VF009_12090 [Solirubrobacterales bacterium]
MSKKIILLVLAAVSVAAFALPATAMAVEEDVPLHLVPKPEGAKAIDGLGSAILTGSFGTIVCTSSSGTGEFTSSTTGTLQLTFGSSTTPKLDFHLVTVEDSVTHATGPGVLVTPNAGTFGNFPCGPFNVALEGNGLIGTLTKPKCGESSSEATIEFSSSSQSVQTHKTVVGTKTEYSVSTLGSPVSLDLSIVITLRTVSKLECT